MDKIKRLIRAIFHSTDTAVYRVGSCKPDQCETLDGDKGHACCKLNYRCPLLTEGCAIYKLRPLNCRVFPQVDNDLKLVKNCGYSFQKKTHGQLIMEYLNLPWWKSRTVFWQRHFAEKFAYGESGLKK